MEKIIAYAAAIRSFLEEYEPVVPHGWKNVRNQIVVDNENHHYQLVRVGWHEGKRIHYIVFHIDIIEGKVWIQQNRTDLPIVEELAALGIPEADIVLGFWKQSLHQAKEVLA